MSDLKPNIRADIDAVARISVVPTILEVICRTTGMGFAAVARVTDEEWIACSVLDEIGFGLKPGGGLVLETTICDEIRQSGKGVIIDHVAEDEHFFNHHTPAMYGFQSYISIPIILKDGNFFGTLCAIDPKPAKLNNPETINMFTLYADLISFHLNALDELDTSKAKLQEERRIAELREQFIAILGHDLRTPVSAISGVAQLLMRMKPDQKIMRFANIIQDSSYRINNLIENLLDFANARLGKGIMLNIKQNEPLQDILIHIVTELQLIWPDHKIEVNFNLEEPVKCDGKRIAQLFSNLLSNAITHGKTDKPVKVDAMSGNGVFKLSVCNSGDKISTEVMQRLFQPFSRGEAKQKQEGLGLGLFIASEIAKAHYGHIDAVSTGEETRFTLIIPSG